MDSNHSKEMHSYSNADYTGMGDKKKYEVERKREDERLKEIMARLSNDESITDEEIVNSRVIANRLKNTSLAFSPTPKHLHSIVPFYSNVIVDLCPHCSQNMNMEHFGEYLKHGLVTPILGSPGQYKEELIELCQQYPYLTTKSYLVLKQKKLFDKFGDMILCPHCNKEYLRIIRSLDVNRQKYPEKKKRIDNITSCLYPVFNFEKELLRLSLDEKYFIDNCDEIYRLALKVFVLRNAQAIHATPVIDFSNSDSEMLKSFPSVEADRMELNNAIMRGLELDYRDNIPMDIYLEIIGKHRKHISDITEKIIKKAGCSEADIHSIKDICREINGEVAGFSTSRKYKLALLQNPHDQNSFLIAS